MAFFFVQTLGCKLNQLESESIIDAFLDAGFDQFKITNASASPSIVIINTCTVTSKADQKARRVIRKALRDFPFASVLVTGCYAQLNKDDILKIETDGKNRLFVVEKNKIINLIQNIDNESGDEDNLNFFRDPANQSLCASLSACESEGKDIFTFNPKQFTNHTRSFLKIQDGCDKSCSYCKIRLARGKSVSLEAEEVLKRLRVLEESHAEAVITGVNISQYRDKKVHTVREPPVRDPQVRSRHGEESKVFDLSELLDYLLAGTNKIAIRLSSLAPESVDDELANVLKHPRIRPHFHLSIQSCSNKILEKMGRAYNAQTIEKAVSLLRGVKNDPFLACDIITGFPGETEAEFEETFDLCRKYDFAWIHVFPYSKRPGTPAFSFKNSIKESEITKRVQLFTDLANKGREAYVKRQIGQELNILIEKEKIKVNELQREKIQYCNGISENYIKVLVLCKAEIPSAGTVIRCKPVKIGNFTEYDAVAEQIM